MRILPFTKIPEKDKVTVKCAGKDVSVYSQCAYCRHCAGVQVGKRTIPTPQREKLMGIQKGLTPDEELLNAAMMYNTLIRDGSAIACENDGDSGYETMY